MKKRKLERCATRTQCIRNCMYQDFAQKNIYVSVTSIFHHQLPSVALVVCKPLYFFIFLSEITSSIGKKTLQVGMFLGYSSKMLISEIHIRNKRSKWCLPLLYVECFSPYHQHKCMTNRVISCLILALQIKNGGVKLVLWGLSPLNEMVP